MENYGDFIMEWVRPRWT